MHNRTKIRIFRVLLRITWLPSLILLYPLARLRKKLDARHVFLLDRYVLGGAQRVHIDILNSIHDVPKVVYFTRFSPNAVMKSAFEAITDTSCRDIHVWCDNLLLRVFFAHYLAFFLNRHRGLTVFSSNSTFFYDLLPWLRPDFRRIELLHNFTYGNKGMEHFGLENYRYLDLRLAVDHFTAQNIRAQYKEAGIPDAYSARVRVIEPGVPVPELAPLPGGIPLKLLYAGRGGPQKRVWLIDRIVAQLLKKGRALELHIAGDAEPEFSPEVRNAAVLHGSISDPAEMCRLYAGCDVIILTSAYEGFPMVIKEGMAQGCIPLVTALPGNLTHLRDGGNALLINAVADEDAVVLEGVAGLERLMDDPALRSRLSAGAFAYARQHFSIRQFTSQYRELLRQPV